MVFGKRIQENNIYIFYFDNAKENRVDCVWIVLEWIGSQLMSNESNHFLDKIAE